MSYAHPKWISLPSWEKVVVTTYVQGAHFLVLLGTKDTVLLELGMSKIVSLMNVMAMYFKIII